MRKINFAAAFLALWTMSVAPLVQGKEAENQARTRAQAILESLGFTGPDKAKNMGEIWARAREALPPETLEKYDLAVSLYRNDPVPQVLIQNVEGRGATEALKLTMNLGPDTISIELPEDVDRGLKVNGVSFSTEEILNNKKSAQDKMISIPYFRNIALKKKDELLTASIVPTLEQFRAMTPLDLAVYRVKVGELLAASEAVTNAFSSSDTAWMDTQTNGSYAVLHFLIGEEALAKAKQGGSQTKGAGTLCIFNGFLSEMSKNKAGTGLFCDKNKIKPENDIKELSDKGKQFCSKQGPKMTLCNPRYMLASGAENGFVCVKNALYPELTKTTETCLEKSVPAQAMISILLEREKAGLKDSLSGNEVKDQTSLDQIKKALEPTIENLLKAKAVCSNTVPPLDSGAPAACAALDRRLIDFQAFLTGLTVKKAIRVTEPSTMVEAKSTGAKKREDDDKTTDKRPTVVETDGKCFGLIKSDLICGGAWGLTFGTIAGFLVGKNVGKKKPKVVTVEKKVEVPGETKTVTVEKIVEKQGPTVYKDREVIKYVPEPAKRPTEYSPAATK
ncbi:MAG: hypothetical protein JNM39_04220 [Bdellovibrionaceae bacterium]|nr:hypothetical protein [Pseudobdellovibrionaceae bacterium]